MREQVAVVLYILKEKMVSGAASGRQVLLRFHLNLFVRSGKVPVVKLR